MAQVVLPGGSTYQNVTTPTMEVTERVQTGSQPAFSFFGIPFGKKPVYSNVTKEVPAYTPVSNYGVNDTGRTLPFNPNPTQPNYRTVTGPAASPYRAPQWAGGGTSQQYQGGGSSGGSMGGGDGIGGLLGWLLGGLPGQQEEPYEAALRERPGDVQNLVSMTRKPGFGGGTVDPNSNFNRQRG
jgi:hypothetical protein